MKITKHLYIGAFALAVVATFALDSNTYAQGRGRGGGGGRPATAGPPSGTGVDRGLGNASSRSNGRSDDGLGKASSRSNGRSDDGIDRARSGRDNANSLTDRELNRYRGLSRKLGMTPEQMRANYAAALAINPDLRYGQFVAANVIADNLGSRNPAITSAAILSGLANGDSIGATLRSLGLSRDAARTAERDAERKIKAMTSRN